MSSIKKFFEKKKSEFKFKKAGPGHKLTENSSSGSNSAVLRSHPVNKREQPSDGSKMAAAAAQARFEQNEQSSARHVMAGHSLSVIRAEARKELEREKNLYDTGVTSNVVKPENLPKEVELNSAPVLSVNGVYFHCPLVGMDILPRAEIENNIKEFLYDQLSEEPGLTACLIIHTCNKNTVKVQTCIETLKKYFDNILMHPDEEKYKKIRVNNKIFQEKVFPIEGSSEFLTASGFEKKNLPNAEGNDEEFWVFTFECADFLTELKENLDAAEPILPELDRNLQVLKFNKITSRINLPIEFYNMTKEELKREQELRAQKVQLDTQLRTKAMREKDEIKERRKYRYTLIRVKFPDDFVLQGTFSVKEKVADLMNFIKENLSNDWLPFKLKTATGQLIDEFETSLLDLRLVPAAIIHADFDAVMINEIKQETGQAVFNYLSTQCLELIQER